MRIITVVGSEGANLWEVLGTGPGTGCVPSKCHLFIYFADSELFFLFFILTSLKSACFLKLMTCHGLNRSIFFFLLMVSKTIVFLKVDGIQSWWNVGCIKVLRYSTVDRKRAGIWGGPCLSTLRPSLFSMVFHCRSESMKAENQGGQACPILVGISEIPGMSSWPCSGFLLEH